MKIHEEGLKVLHYTAGKQSNGGDESPVEIIRKCKLRLRK